MNTLINDSKGWFTMPNVYEFVCDQRSFPEHRHILCSGQLALHESLVLPMAKPDIERLVEVKVHPVIDSFRILSSGKGKKVVITGHLEEVILYIADAACQPVHAAHFSWPFATFLDLPSCCANYALLEQYPPRVIVEYVQAEQICSREISKTVILFIWYPILELTPPPPHHHHRYIVPRKKDDIQ